ncbi:MAG: hypothetical protein ABDH28_03495 [Brevinematia bacterium]
MLRKIVAVLILTFIWTSTYGEERKKEILTNLQLQDKPSEPKTNEISFYELLGQLENQQFKTNFYFSGTNLLTPIELKERKSLRVSLEFEESLDLKKEPFFLSFERRYEIILLVSIPTTYMVTKFLMEQVSFYNYRDFTRSLNTQQWSFIIASSIIIPLIVAVEDHIKYKEFVEQNLRF